jgi:hypothetical protein
MVYLKRARDAHQRYTDQDGRADTLFSTACILVEVGDLEGAQTYCEEASAIVAITGSTYDRVHEHITRGVLALARKDSQEAILHGVAARQLAEPQGLMSYYNYATAIEAAGRIDAGEGQPGIALAQTAFAAVEAMAGSEYAIEVRVLCCAALSRGAPDSARDVILRAAAHVKKVAGYVRDPRLKSLFLRRSVVERILIDAKGAGADVHLDDPLTRGGTA